MLPKKQRLGTKALKRALKSRGNTYTSKDLRLKVVDSGDAGGSGLAVVVSKRGVGGAVLRNKQRRLLYSCAAHHLDARKIGEKATLFFLSKKEGDVDKKDIEYQVSKLLTEAGLTK